ncbi:AI-2E family transporter [Brevundimonas sp. S30B]|uniref:AI-2E family transporter n=1 Tax=unclassified Brevundimonas TaxID=2622653 RepID=UPI001071F2EE|nr:MULTISPECIES: AI-2E family transporter [unclassified Brevundimonas]QBX37148.1 AI-2E family transporter [Brevundimonas sp. MF30-B]TFW04057.1 AI-2E family transporter [Brevundimonas sp. S30B]
MKPPIAVPASTVSRNALVLLAVVAGGAALYWLRDILTPLAMAIFLMIMIDGVKRAIERRTPLPHRFAGAAALILVILGFFASIAIIINGAAGFFSEASGVTANIGPRIDQILADGSRLFGVANPPTAMDLINGIDLRGYLTQLAFQVQGIASGAFFVLIYLGFLLASQAGFRKKIVGMFPDRTSRNEAVEVFGRVRSGVEGYLWVQAVTGVMICAVAWGLMKAVGLQNAEFWTFVIFIVGFIPILGGAISGLAPPLFALVQFDSYGPALILLVGLQAILFIVGNWIQPRMQGDNQNIDPVVVLLSLALWGHLWGVIGMFLSTPLAVMAMAILAEFKGSRWVAVLLSGDGEPYAEPRGAKADPPAAKGRGGRSQKPAADGP